MRALVFAPAIAVTLTALYIAACDEDDGPKRRAVRAPTVSVLGAVRQTGAPDAGTAAGHGGDLVVSAFAASTVLHGTVRPADARVSLAARGGRTVTGRVDGSGRFSAHLSGLRPGANDFVLRAARRDARPVSRALRVVRRAPPRTIVVPHADRSPPEVVVSVVDERGRVLASSGGELAPHVPYLPWTTFSGDLWAVALARDFDGGVARIRVSLRERVDCLRAGGSRRRERRVRYIPPPAIERVRITAGTRVPTTRARRVRIGARPGVCGPGERAVSSVLQVWGEANNAHGLESVSTHVRVRQRR